ncbi:MAG: DUF3336 domain-containing protein [Pseudomonadales bacterium]
MSLFTGVEDRLTNAIKEATDYTSWTAASQAHDEHTGMDRWKAMDQTRMYDHVSIRTRLDKLRILRSQGDYHGLLFTLNEGIHGNMGGMGNAALYERAKFGTKQLIVDYIDEICETLEIIEDVDESVISFAEKHDFIHRASHCFGRSALMLSGGAMLGNFHLGVVKNLLEEGLLPKVISGSSAGSIIAAVLGTHTNEQLLTLFDSVHLRIEAQKEASWFARMLWSKTPQIDIKDVRDFIDRLVPDMTFAEAFELTGRQINITVAPAELQQTSRLLNAVTSPNVHIRAAVLASSAVPGIYPPVTLEAKNVHGERQPYLPSRKWVDGSVSDDLPAKRLARLYGVNHFVVSQTNPIVLPFLLGAHSDSAVIRNAFDLGHQTFRGTMRAGQKITRPYVQRWPRLGLLLNTWFSLGVQDYMGDVNIIPDYRFVDPRKLLAEPTEDEVMRLIEAGERATWPKIEMMRECSKISRTLDAILTRMDAVEREATASLKLSMRSSKRSKSAPIKATPATKPKSKSKSKVQSKNHIAA